MLKLFARPELPLYPMRLLSSAGPCLGIIFWVLVFRKNLRIGTVRRPIGPNRAFNGCKPAKALFARGLLLRYPASQNRSHLFVQTPQLICGHGFESIAFHGLDPPVLFPPGQGALRRKRKFPWRRRRYNITSYHSEQWKKPCSPGEAEFWPCILETAVAQLS